MGRIDRDHGVDEKPRNLYAPSLLGSAGGIYYHYGIDKVQLDHKMFGIFCTSGNE